MNKGALIRKNCNRAEGGGRKEFGQMLGKGLPQITVCKTDLISLTVEKDAREAEILIESFLMDIRLPGL